MSNRQRSPSLSAFNSTSLAATSSLAMATQHVPQNDIYADLSKFTFGETSSAGREAREDNEGREEEEEEDRRFPDDTPRPSVASANVRRRDVSPPPPVPPIPPDATSGSSNSPGDTLARLAARRRRPNPYQNDTASRNTFGLNTRASASGTSSSSRPSSSYHTEEEEGMTFGYYDHSGDNSGAEVDVSSEYGQEEYEFDSSAEEEGSELDEEDPDAHVIEVGSAQYGSTDAGHSGFIPFSGRRNSFSFVEGEESARRTSYSSESHWSFNAGSRRGSLPMSATAISPFSRTDDSNSIISRRRPSRSLDDDLASHGSVFGLTNERRTSSSTISAHAYRHPASLQTQAAVDFTADFDADWGNMAGGITTLNNPIVPNLGGASLNTGIPTKSTAPASPTSGRRPSAMSFRRNSLANFFNVTSGRRASEISVASSMPPNDTFEAALGSWDRAGFGVQKKTWTFKREKADSSGPGAMLKPVMSHSTLHSSTSAGAALAGRKKSVDVSTLNPDQNDMAAAKAQAVAEDKERRSPANWRGMSISAGEVWRNMHVGRYSIVRMAIGRVESSHKGPQHRLAITHVRDAYSKVLHSSPPIIIHKHSKAVAFSISRFYGRKPRSNQQQAGRRLSEAQNGRAPERRHGESSDLISPGRTGMVLLAPRRVQLAFTNTTTTRKLEGHGWLEDDQQREQQQQRAKEAAKEEIRRKDKEKVKKEKRKKDKGKDKDLGSGSGSTAAESGQTSSAGSVTSTSKGPSTASVVNSVSSHTSAGSSAPRDQAPVASSSTSPPSIHTYPPQPNPPSRPSSRRRRDSLDIDEDDEDDETLDENGRPRNRAFRRTPHSEAYGAIEPSEQARALSDYKRSGGVAKSMLYPDGGYERTTTGFLTRMMGGRSGGPGGNGGRKEASYDPPWLTLSSRTKQEQQQRVVENLNASFQDVGLLPAAASKPRSGLSSAAKRPGSSAGTSTLTGGSSTAVASTRSRNSIDVFQSVPSDALLMVLPLWPGSTDFASTREAYVRGYKLPEVPLHERKFLLVCYKATDSPSTSSNTNQTSSSGSGGRTASRSKSEKQERNKDRSKSKDGKKGSRSQTSSAEHTTSANSNPSYNRMDERNILLSAFHISARFFSYQDIQGSGIRIPNDGLCVSGPIEHAYLSRPLSQTPQQQDGQVDWIVLGSCHSREAGITFDPEGLGALGLCTLAYPKPEDSGEPEEAYSLPAPDVNLTPIGRAVIEMAWSGGMALTSFGEIASNA